MAMVHLEFNAEDIKAFFSEIRQTQWEAKKMMHEAMNSVGTTPRDGSKLSSVEKKLDRIISFFEKEAKLVAPLMTPSMIDAIKNGVIRVANNHDNKFKPDDKEAPKAEEEWL